MINLNNSQLLNLLSLFFRGPGKMFIHARADHLNAKKKCDECGEIYKLSVYKQHKIRKHGPGKSDDLIKVENLWIILKSRHPEFTLAKTSNYIPIKCEGKSSNGFHIR